MNATLYVNANLATMDAADREYGWVDDGAIAVKEGWIVWVGPRDSLPEPYRQWPRVDLGGAVVTPGLIDCHTHLIFGGNRAAEFELRLKGASYEQIAAQGGGILSTVAATRQATEEELVTQALPRLDRLLAEGITTIEIKSGYGLDIESELRMLSAARRLGELRPVRVRTS